MNGALGEIGPTEPRLSGRRRSIVTRILLSYLVLLCAFVVSSGFAVLSLRRAADEASLLRQGYLPLALSVRDLVANQDAWNSQLNHITTADNPADKRVWFDTALSLGRPRKLAEVQAAIDRALGPGRQTPFGLWQELSQDLTHVQKLMAPDKQALPRLFELLGRGERAEAAKLRDELVVRGLRVQRALGGLEARITAHVDGLADATRARETAALWVLIFFSGLAFLVGVLMALYARSVVLPVLDVTRRASAVAGGDLRVRPAITSRDEIGELSVTFEAMVRAVAATRERLLTSERLAAIGKLSAHVTHEVRNPLSSIALNLELLEDEIPAEQREARALLAAIGQEVQRLTVLSAQYLSMARQNDPEFTETDVAETVRGALEFLRRDLERHGVVVELGIEGQLPHAFVDVGQLRQALLNLLRNAREAMPGGGRVKVEVYRPSPAFLAIAVEDSGPGIEPSQAERLFDPFFTTKEHGTGLGLAVTRQIAEAHGGTLRYERAEGRGARFVLALPLPGPNLPGRP